MPSDTGVTNFPATDNLDLPSDAATRSPTTAGDGHYVFLEWMQRVTGGLRAIFSDLTSAMVHDLPMNGHRITGLVAPSASSEPLIKSQLDTDTTLAANSDTRVPSQKAIKAYADALIAAADAMVFKGVIDCSSNPNYPAADRGHTYRVSVAGKIGGASGTNVEVGDLLLCLTDGTASGTQAGVGANWEIAQANIDGAVTGPASSTSGHFATFSGTSGKVIQDALALDTDGTLAANSDTRVPSQKAAKTYIDLKATDTLVVHLAGTEVITGAKEFQAAVTLTDVNLVLSATTGTKIGTGTTQKLGFWNATPVAQISGSTDVLAGLVTVGLRAASSNPPLNMGTGALTCGGVTTGTIGSGAHTIVAATAVVALSVRGDSGNSQPLLNLLRGSDGANLFQIDQAGKFANFLGMADGTNFPVGTGTGTKIGTATSQKIGLWNATPIIQPTTGVAAATFVANTSAIANDTATWDGYTIGQVVKALRNIGALA